MIIPRKFRAVHSKVLEQAYHVSGPVFNMLPKEPIGRVSDKPLDLTEMTVTMVSVRVTNDRGTLRIEPFSPADLAVMEDWEVRHRDTPVEEFDWLPSCFGRI